MSKSASTKKRLAIGDRWIAPNRLGVFYVYWLDKAARQTRRISLRTDNAIDAINMVQNWQIADFSGHPCDVGESKEPNKKCTTLADALDIYMDKRGKKLASAEQARIACKKLKQHLGNISIIKLEDDDIEEFVEALIEDGLSIAYISRILSTLRAALNFAVKKKLIKFAPKIQEIRTKAHMDAEPLRGRELSVSEVAKLFDAAQEPHVLIFLVFLVFTLSRPGALLELTYHQIDWHRRYLDLNPAGRLQTKKHRPTVGISPTLFLWLGWAIKQAGPQGHLVHYCGAPIASMKQAFRGLVKRAGLEGRVSAYSIRHTVARWLRGAVPRVPGDEISIVLGHIVVDSKKVTERYSPFDPDYLVHATPAIEKFFLEVTRHCQVHNLLKPGELM